jgi:Cu(I)/Ag(I) efflux system membrane fusion protein
LEIVMTLRSIRNALPRLLLLYVMVSVAACADKAAVSDSSEQSDANSHAEPANRAEPEVLYWYDPMRPEVHFDAPGRSPFMDMDLVPMYADNGGAGDGIAVSPAVQQTLGMRLGRVERGSVRPRLRASAQVRPDQDSRWMLLSRADGWVERLHVHEVGELVEAGQILAEIYSPVLVQAQEEMLLSEAAAPGAIERLRRLGIAQADIDAVRASGASKRRLPLRAAVSGSVVAITIHHGGRATPDKPLLEVVARDRIWVEARLFPGQAEWLGEPVDARFELPGRPGTEWLGEAGFLYPQADPVSQTQSLRFVLRESTQRLPPGAWLNAELSGALRHGVLLIPAEAVIRTGAGARVVKQTEAGNFESVDVELGERYDERIEVRSGLDEGDAIVVSGQFLLDSEAELRSGMRRMRAPETDPPDNESVPDAHSDHREPSDAEPVSPEKPAAPAERGHAH